MGRPCLAFFRGLRHLKFFQLHGGKIEYKMVRFKLYIVVMLIFINTVKECPPST